MMQSSLEALVTDTPTADRPPTDTTFQAVADTLDGVEVGLCLFDDEDRALLWNRSFLRLFPEHAGHVRAGEPYAENLRRFYRGRLSPEELGQLDQYVEAGIERHRAQMRPYEFDHRGRRIRVSSLRLPAGGRVRVWRELGESDADSDARMESYALNLCNPVIDPASSAELLDRVPDGLAICAADGCMIWVNAPFVTMYGLADRSVALGVTFESVFRTAWGQGPDPQPAPVEAMTLLREHLHFTGVPFELPLPGERWHRIIARPAGDGAMFIAHVDITELKHEQERLRSARQNARAQEALLREKSVLLEATLHNIEQGVFLICPEGRIRFHNQRAVDLLGLPADFLQSMPTLTQVAEYQKSQGEFESISPALHRHLEVDLDSRHGLPGVYERRRPNGTVLEVRTVEVPGMGMLRTYSDITERRRNEERIRFAANHDSLTGLLNRGLFMECLQSEVMISRRTGLGCAVHFIDLDGFKPINDTHGHAVGDQALVHVAAVLRQVARESDFIARLGGDEFAVLQRGVSDRAQARRLVARLREQLEKPFSVNGLPLKLGASVGLAVYPGDGDDPQSLLRCADHAMYQDKNRRR